MSEVADTEANTSIIKIVIDTSVWISFLIGKALNRIEDQLAKDNVVLLCSDELFDEIFEVPHRPRIKKYITDEQIFEIIAIIQTKSEWVTIQERTDICRDKKDNFLLDLAYNGKADYLVTGDQDLLVIGEYKNTKIMDFREFDKRFSPPRKHQPS